MSAALRLGFAGTPEFSVPALERLHAGSRVCAVFTRPGRPAGRGQALQASPVKRRAQELGLPILQPATLKADAAQEQIRDLRLDVLVVVAYGLLLPAAVLQLPRLGCINIHASLLPRWRGAAPIQRALLAGDAQTGVTIMRMEAGLDTGPMLAAGHTEIAAEDNAATLHDRLAAMGASLIGETLPQLAAGALREIVQPEIGATYASKIEKREAVVDWNQDAAHIWRQIRAFNPWPVAATQLHGTQLRLWDAELAQASPAPSAAPGGLPGAVLAAGAQGVDVACGRGIVRITRLQLAGRKPLAARDFLAARPLTGVRLGDA